MVSTILLNQIFLPQIYTNSKINTLEEIYQTISLAGAKQDFSIVNSSREFKKLSANQNTSIYLLNIEDPSHFRLEFPFAIENSVSQEIQKTAMDYYNNGGLSEDETVRTTYQFNGEEIKESLTGNSNYRIYQVYDTSVSSYYLELIGLYSEDGMIYLRSNMAALDEMVSYFNWFLIFVCCITGFLGIIFIYFMVSAMTKPLLQLSKQAKQLAKFQFHNIQKSNRKDEIGTLTNSFYFLTKELQKRIKEIKEKNIKLKQDIQKKEEIDTLRKEFISNISHELKTPICIIQGYAEVLPDLLPDDSSDTMRSYCDTILEESNKMNQLVQRMLTLNKLEFGNVLVDCSTFFLDDLIQASLSSRSLYFQEHEIQIDTTFIQQAEVYTDEFMLEDVVTNYLTNACNYCSGEKRIEVKMRETEDSYIVSVFNTGDPIPEESLDQIWVKFYKVDKARSREYGGSGIGLSIVKSTMDLLDGSCGVRNETDGVTFWFSVKKANK